MTASVDPDLDYASEYTGHGYGIGIVGAGAIVEAAHLPAYAAADFTVVGLYDRDVERAEKVASDAPFDITVYDELAGLLADDGVDVVDISVPPTYQRDIVEEVLESSHHVLCQKPLSDTLSAAQEIVRMIEQSDSIGAVNQQMRWQKSMRTVHSLLDSGELGTPLRGKIEVNIETDWSAWEWLVASPRLEVMYHSIHYLDTIRYLFGEPNTISSSMARAPDQLAAGETRTIHTLEYDGELRATIDANHNNWADSYAEFRFEGTEGVVRGTIGLFDDYPESGSDTFEFRDRSMDEWETHQVENAWFPDAFIGTMGSLLERIETSGQPPTHPRDNIKTLKLANAAYRSANERTAVRPSKVTTDEHYEG